MVLIGYWPLNESSGATEAKDHSGNENHGTINDGGDSTVPGQSGGILGQKTYSFDGSNDYVDLGFSELQIPCTISFWAVPDIENPDSYPDIFSNFNSGSDDFYIDQNKDTSGDWRFRWDAGDVFIDPITHNFSADDWVHIIITIFRDKLRVYVNGLKTDEVSHSTTANVDNGFNFLVGGEHHTSTYWKGKMSELRVYNHALTPSEIQYLYQVSQQGQLVSGKKSS
jgi:hypothetical protein